MSAYNSEYQGMDYVSLASPEVPIVLDAGKTKEEKQAFTFAMWVYYFQANSDTYMGSSAAATLFSMMDKMLYDCGSSVRSLTS